MLFALPLLLLHAEPTYCNDVAAILQRRCQACHHPGTAAPFSLMTFEDAVKHIDNLKEAVADRRMPPWFADPRFGKFRNDPSLSEQELRVISAWQGALGNKKDLPPALAFADGWTISEPDIVLEQPKEQVLLATGRLDFYRAIVPNPFKEDVWISAYEVRPSDPAVVHHVNLHYSTPCGPVTFIKAHPGRMFATLPQEQVFKIPAGATITWETHYEPYGKATRDRTKVGLKLYNGKPPDRMRRIFMIFDPCFLIPPGDPNYEVVADCTTPCDQTIFNLSPHMHARGKDFTFEIIYPDARKETLLRVSPYNFSWQLIYELQEPLHWPKGATIRCIAHFDNSAANPNNPDPKARVFWGDHTDSEMDVGVLDIVGDTLPQLVRRPVQPAIGPTPTGPPPGALATRADGSSWIIWLGGLPAGVLVWVAVRKRRESAKAKVLSE